MLAQSSHFLFPLTLSRLLSNTLSLMRCGAAAQFSLLKSQGSYEFGGSSSTFATPSPSIATADQDHPPFTHPRSSACRCLGSMWRPDPNGLQYRRAATSDTDPHRGLLRSTASMGDIGSGRGYDDRKIDPFIGSAREPDTPPWHLDSSRQRSASGTAMPSSHFR